MPRRPKKRRIGFAPSANYFKPAGKPLNFLSEITLGCEELEALRLNDLLQKDQKQAAEQMDISQPTFHRLVLNARKKITDALVHGKAIKIEGGHYTMQEKQNNVHSKNKLTVAVSASSENLEGNIDSRFGRCPYFLLVFIEDKKTTSFKAVKNMQADIRGGAGIASAQTLANRNVDAVISDNIGPRALDVLSQFQIPVYRASGDIKTAVNRFLDNSLEQIKD